MPSQERLGRTPGKAMQGFWHGAAVGDDEIIVDLGMGVDPDPMAFLVSYTLDAAQRAF